MTSNQRQRTFRLRSGRGSYRNENPRKGMIHYLLRRNAGGSGAGTGRKKLKEKEVRNWDEEKGQTARGNGRKGIL